MNIKEKIAVMQAFESGENIECQQIGKGLNWTPVPNPIWAWGTFEYRIKEPTVLELLEKLKKDVDECSHVDMNGLRIRLHEIIKKVKL